jgi:CDP-paratose 2-epimerase
MQTKRALITGSSGLIGSEAVAYFDAEGWATSGVDNNMRRDFFGPDGDTSWNLDRLRASTRLFEHHAIDVRDRTALAELVRQVRPSLIIHCAAQPSHDLASKRPFDDFDINAVGTLNLLEAVRNWCQDSPFIFMSTNKVYGDAPNEVPLVEQATRFDYADLADYAGIRETCRLDATTHSLFGASKAAADLLVQEYGRYFGMATVCLRAGCLTGPNHSGTELHGFLAYLARSVREGRRYRIYGYKGKQVRDNIHSFDVCRFFHAYYEAPRSAAVYNIGGGRENSVSMLEAISALKDITGLALDYEYIDENRIGDHICYISDLSKIHEDYPSWAVTRTLPDILDELTQVAVPRNRA